MDGVLALMVETLVGKQVAQSLICFNKYMSRFRLKNGFTLIEVIIVVTILALLAIVLLSTVTKQRVKGEDARVKSDLERLKIAFEDYYNDNNCYPPDTWFDEASDCGSGNLSPYLSSIPCDFRDGVPYHLDHPEGGTCGSFALYANFRNEEDPSAFDVTSQTGGSYNYAVSSTNISLGAPDTGGDTGGETNGYYCSAQGNCTTIPTGRTCSPTFADADCGGTPTNKCPLSDVDPDCNL